MKKSFLVPFTAVMIFSLSCIVLVTALCGPASADRGSFVLRPPTMKENIDVFDAGQKAIICWRNGEELMILSTDKYASAKSKVLEFMPLPSKPSRVEEAKEEVFQGIARLISNHRPAVPEGKSPGRALESAQKDSSHEPSVEIVFHKKIGAHDINIAKINHLDGFGEWVKKFYTMNQLQYMPEDVARLHPLVKDYLDRGYSYYVFDVIELTTEKRSIAPILYQFKSPSLYFPLKVTTLSEGDTDVALYLFTPSRTDIWGTGTGFKSGFYTFSGKADYAHPIKFQVSPLEIKAVSDEIVKFMAPGYTGEKAPGKPQTATYGDDEAMKRITREDKERPWFSTAKFTGSTKKLTRDFLLKPRSR
ncbi:MAG: DUF2330 domain-containing protein [Candidatus Eremiobacteraeota bacterium]|nr:DUF2330 domain-containing protein [Candidatus Eremiobacteraeota bacterium]